MQPATLGDDEYHAINSLLILCLSKAARLRESADEPCVHHVIRMLAKRRAQHPAVASQSPLLEVSPRERAAWLRRPWEW